MFQWVSERERADTMRERQTERERGQILKSHEEVISSIRLERHTHTHKTYTITRSHYTHTHTHTVHTDNLAHGHVVWLTNK